MSGQDVMKTGDTLGGFKIEAVLGRGGMGVVYKAHELSLNRKVALKVLSTTLSSDKEFIQRFKREAQVVARLNHPNIVKVLSYGEEQGLYYFAMEYISGSDLREILHQKKVIPVEEALSIVAQVAGALAEAGTNGIVHRDIKPSNIMIDKMGGVHVTDFGVAHFTESSDKLTKTGLFLGTPEYASPEQATGRPLDVRSDIYSLGAVLYEMLSGQVPISGESPLSVMTKIATETVTPISEVNPSVPKHLCDLVDKMMAKDLDERFQTPQGLVAAIKDCVDKIGLDAPSARTTIQDMEVTLAAPGKRRPYVGILGGILGIALAVLLVVWLVEGHLFKKTVPSGSKGASVVVPDTPSLPSGSKEESAVVSATSSPQSTHVVQSVPAQRDEHSGNVGDKEPHQVTAKVDDIPVLPEIPAVLVAVSGDDKMIPVVRAHLNSMMLNSGLKIIPMTEIPILREKVQFGEIQLSWYDIKTLMPDNRAQVLMLAEIRKTGSMPLEYYGRTQELTLATFSVQAVDMSTGVAIHSAASGAIKFTPMNMNENIQREITAVAGMIGAEIRQYWKEKRQSMKKGG